MAAIFMQTAKEEQAHAKRFFKFLEGGPVENTAIYPAGIIGTTAENLKAAAEGENEEWTELYPEFAEFAKEEGFPKIASAFKMITKVEAEHEKCFLKLLQNVSEKALENCPACLNPQKYMKLMAKNY